GLRPASVEIAGQDESDCDNSCGGTHLRSSIEVFEHYNQAVFQSARYYMAEPITPPGQITSTRKLGSRLTLISKTPALFLLVTKTVFRSPPQQNLPQPSSPHPHSHYLPA